MFCSISSVYKFAKVTSRERTEIPWLFKSIMGVWGIFSIANVTSYVGVGKLSVRIFGTCLESLEYGVIVEDWCWRGVEGWDEVEEESRYIKFTFPAQVLYRVKTVAVIYTLSPPLHHHHHDHHHQYSHKPWMTSQMIFRSFLMPPRNVGVSEERKKKESRDFILFSTESEQEPLVVSDAD